MDDLRKRIEMRKRARRKKMCIRLGILAVIVAIIIIGCVSCNNSGKESNNDSLVTESPSPIPEDGDEIGGTEVIPPESPVTE